MPEPLRFSWRRRSRSGVRLTRRAGDRSESMQPFARYSPRGTSKGVRSESQLRKAAAGEALVSDEYTYSAMPMLRLASAPSLSLFEDADKGE